MKEKNIQEILGLLRSYNPANKSEVGRLAELVYPHLRRIAAGLLTRENRIGASIQATMLADDSIIRLIVKKKVESKDWPHFLSIAAKTMREMLIDHIRVKRAKRRYFGVQVELVDDLHLGLEMEDVVMALHDAIERLDPEYRELLEMHYFIGATIDELARHFGVTERTVKRRLAAARLRLHSLLTDRKTTT